MPGTLPLPTTETQESKTDVIKFGTDGWRAVIADDFTFTNVRRVAGAIASYVRIGEFYPPLVPLTTAMLAWLGLFLRDERVRELLPIRRMRK